jgi:hypothetical protein
MPFPFLALLPVVGKLLDKLIPDADAANKAKAKLAEMAHDETMSDMRGEIELAMQQIMVNREEAKAGPFRGGWRPFIGWVCGAAFAYNFVLLPLLTWVATIAAIPVPPAAFDLTVMMPVLLGMLGLGGMRSFEKGKGLA